MTWRKFSLRSLSAGIEMGWQMMNCSGASTNLLLSATASNGWIARTGWLKIPKPLPNRFAGIAAFRSNTLPQFRRDLFSETGSVGLERTNEAGL